MSEILVIGYGNTLRGDDAAGVRAAELLGNSVDDLDVIIATDLSLELAEPISTHDHVIFIDASAGGDSVRLRNIDAKTPPPAITTHANFPWTLLEASRTIYGRVPHRTILATIPGESFDLGEILSERTGHLVAECVNTLREEILKLRERSGADTDRVS
jgi:hydrogenase maturation protease